MSSESHPISPSKPIVDNKEKQSLGTRRDRWYGDYHRNLDPNWSYTPTYLQKMAILKRFLQQLPNKAAIFNAVVVVKEYWSKRCEVKDSISVE